MAVVSLDDPRREAPDPMPELTQAEREVWEKTVAVESPDLFRTFAMRTFLKMYCRHVALAEDLSKIIQDAKEKASSGDKDAAAVVSQLARTRVGEVSAAGQLATRMRLTNYSRFSHKRAASNAQKAAQAAAPLQPERAKPWAA